MNLRNSLATAIKMIRKSKGLTQEDFSVVSSRTYLSSLERGLKSPTIDKIDEISQVLKIHPAVLVILAYAMQVSPLDRTALIKKISMDALEVSEKLM